MKTRIKRVEAPNRPTLYYPQYRFMFVWCHYTITPHFSVDSVDLKFTSLAEAEKFLDDQLKKVEPKEIHLYRDKSSGKYK